MVQLMHCTQCGGGGGGRRGGGGGGGGGGARDSCSCLDYRYISLSISPWTYICISPNGSFSPVT